MKNSTKHTHRDIDLHPNTKPSRQYGDDVEGVFRRINVCFDGINYDYDDINTLKDALSACWMEEAPSNPAYNIIDRSGFSAQDLILEVEKIPATERTITNIFQPYADWLCENGMLAPDGTLCIDALYVALLHENGIN